ncbi:MAG: energy transducer TonB [Thiobacillus sp.]|nr:energy transducer TonB [Thiobacillus sp.]
MESRPPLMRTIAPALRIAPPRLSLGVLASVILIHVGILAAILSLPKTTPSVIPPAPLYVRLIEAAALQPELAPPPVPPRLQPPPTPSVPPPVLAAPPAPLRPIPEAVKPKPVEPARPDISRPEPQAVPIPAPAPAPTPTAAEAPKPAPPPPQPVTQPRFNADYLDNPKPPYPGVSRRMGEEGEVRLRVHVDTTGHAQQIEVYRSSGFPRLDQAALDTVKQWRFVPARQGDQPIPAWVIVPIQFSLRS